MALSLNRTQVELNRQLTPLEPRTNDEVHRPLLKTNKTDYDIHPVKAALKVKDFIESLPKYSATFKVGEICSDKDLEEYEINTFMLKLYGAWPIPDYYSGHSNKNIWVNPNYEHIGRYAQGLSECRCGTLVSRPSSNGDRELKINHDRVDDHSDDCLVEWRYRAYADLVETRREIIEDVAEHGISPRESTIRLGYSSDSSVTRFVNSHINNYHFDPNTGLTHEFKQKQANTMAELLLVFKSDVVGEVYNGSRSIVQHRINNYTDYDMAKLYQFRRKHKYNPA